MEDAARRERARPVGSDRAIGGTGVDGVLLDRLLPHLTESIMVLDADWTVVANLAPPGGLIGRGLGLGHHTLEDMHPDDSVKVLELGAQAFATGPGWEGSMIVRMRRGDGAYGRYEITAINRFDDPVVAGMVIRTREVVDDVKVDLGGLGLSGMVETLAQILPVGVVLLDPAGRPVYANGAASELLGCTSEELKARGLEAMVLPEQRDRLTSMITHGASGASRFSTTLQLERSAVYVQCTLTSEGEPVPAVVVSLEDLTERRAFEQDLRRRADHDALTGLRNRAALLDDLRVHLDEGATLVVAYVDLDGFKAVNDAGGHAAGDALLVAVAGALRAGVGPGVEVARLGGDEFVAVALGEGRPDAETLATLLRTSVEELDEARRAGVGASVGTATPRRGDSPRDLLHRADEAMYQDKWDRRMADPA